VTAAVATLVLGAAAALAGAQALAGEEPALTAAVRRGDRAGLVTLLRSGADPDRGDAAGWTALHQAVELGDVASVRVLLDEGAQPDLRARSRGTPLDVAETSGRPDVARLLRARGARGSGKSVGASVCVRPWAGEGYCALVLGRDATRFELRVSRVVGCERGCAAEPPAGSSRRGRCPPTAEARTSCRPARRCGFPPRA
jgi:hypothetical protein